MEIQVLGPAKFVFSDLRTRKWSDLDLGPFFHIVVCLKVL